MKALTLAGVAALIRVGVKLDGDVIKLEDRTAADDVIMPGNCVVMTTEEDTGEESEGEE